MNEQVKPTLEALQDPLLREAIARDHLWWALKDMETLAKKARDIRHDFGVKPSEDDRRRITWIKTELDDLLK